MRFHHVILLAVTVFLFQSSLMAQTPDLPCDWVNAEELRDLMEVPKSIEIEMEARDYTFPACSFEWKDGKVIKTMEVAGRTMEIESPSEVMVVLVKEATAEKFERSTQVYKDGTAEAGIGDEAVWGAEMSQLTFRKGTVMMHIHVKADNESSVNKKKALFIAEFLLGKM